MTTRQSIIGVEEQVLYTAPNGCYVVKAISLEDHYDIRSPSGEYRGGILYQRLSDAKRGADKGGENIYE